MPGTRLLNSAGSDSVVRTWGDLETKPSAIFEQKVEGLTSMAIAAKNPVLAVADQNGIVHLWGMRELPQLAP
jgi:WD40 repeat protein